MKKHPHELPEDKRVFVRTPYNYDMNKASDEAGLTCPEPTRTQQHFKDECDINTIVKRFGVTGELPIGTRAPRYGDFTGVSDFQTAMNAVARANEAFDALPASWRKRFDHDPQKFLEFCEKEENRDEAVRLGLVMPAAADLAASAPKGEETPPKTTAPAPKGAAGPSGASAEQKGGGVT